MFVEGVVPWIIIVACLVDYGEAQVHKIHMVASENDVTKPAIFPRLESPVWDSLQNCLYFVDPSTNTVYKLDYMSGSFQSKVIPPALGQVQVISLVSSTRRVLVAARAALYLLDWEVPVDTALRPLTHVDDGAPDNAISLGLSDVFGRYWFVSRGPNYLPDRGTLYSVEQSSLPFPQVHVRPAASPAGVAWAPNNSVMYYADAIQRKIDAFDFDVTKGVLANRRTVRELIDVHSASAVPAGLAVDTNGWLWVALTDDPSLVSTTSVVQLNPNTGGVIARYRLPITKITNLCWGGPHLDEMFITTSQEGVNLQATPLAGAIFTIRESGYKGDSGASFKLDNADVY